MAVALAALAVASSGVAWAASELPRNSVGSAEVRNNSLRSGDIRDGNVRHADLGRNSVHGEKVADDSLGGDKIIESDLGRVPSAANAENAEQLSGRRIGDFITNETIVPFRVKLNFGESREFVRVGNVSLQADCRENIAAQGQDELRLLARTTRAPAYMQGDTPHSGPGVGSDVLTPETLADNRTMGGIVSTQAGEGQPAAEDDIDTGFVAGPNGEYIGIDETTMYALHLGGSDCLLVGAATVLPAG